MPRALVGMLKTYWLWCGMVSFGIILFLASPGGYGAKAHTVLHGLCAQTPAHTFMLGGQSLPFDGRMTGIYGGTLAGFLYLALRRRILFYGNPSAIVISFLAGFVGLMALDGFNSLFADLGIWHPYEPRNLYRLVTGFGTGIALAVTLSWLLASSMWNLSSPKPGLSTMRDLGGMVLIGVPYGLAIYSGSGWLFAPISALLLTSAWLTLTVLMLVVVLLLFRIDERVRDVPQLHVPGALAAAMALVVILSLAAGRFWLERTFGIPMNSL